MQFSVVICYNMWYNYFTKLKFAQAGKGCTKSSSPHGTTGVQARGGYHMKNWTIPAAVAQQFAANEYVSACDPMLLNCDLCIDEVGDGKKYPRLHIHGTMLGGAMDGEEVHANFYGCGAEYLEVQYGELSKLTVTHYRYGSEVEGAEPCDSHWIRPIV